MVTPRHILEQFQHEMWTRFAIPLVRLDCEGIQRVRRRIPAGRNPFTYYKRAIISIDTLKNAGRYRHHLEGIRWDAVVIDECHNVMNRSAARNNLVRVLAPRTDALLMLSATPHNGDPESFAELIRLTATCCCRSTAPLASTSSPPKHTSRSSAAWPPDEPA